MKAMVSFAMASVPLFFSTLPGTAEERFPGPTKLIVVPNASARLIELTAVINVTNESPTHVRKYFFRVTMPPSDLLYQCARLTSSIPDSVQKKHGNGIDQYLELKLALPAHRTITRKVNFLVLLVPVDYQKVSALVVPEKEKRSVTEYLHPAALVESDAPEVKQAAASLFADRVSDFDRARAAYEYPARVLKYRVQPPAGALRAIQTGSGDCTEYACLFCALCRAGGVPARRAAAFNLGSKTELTVEQPNHDLAEVFLAAYGWVPVDPNVGGGKYDRPVGFAKAGNTAIVLKREDAWVWSTFLPPDGLTPSSSKPGIKAEVKWQVQVVREGTLEKLHTEFLKGNP
jgi:transglutaminase-like putative cysteine protease